MNKVLTALLLSVLSLPAFSRHRGIPPQASPPASCSITGKIVSMLKPEKEERGSPCGRYPCRARVRIVSVEDCGSGVSAPLNTGDTVVIRFAYTLSRTSRIYPAMKMKYPGLKRGARFMARVTQQLRPGGEGGFTVYGYTLK